MANSFAELHYRLHQLSEPILESLSKTHYTQPETGNVSTKSTLESLLPNKTSNQNLKSSTENQIRDSIKNFALACALLSSSSSSTHELLSWIPNHLSVVAESSFREISRCYTAVLEERNADRIEELGLINEETRLVLELIPELIPEVLPVLKNSIKESSIDKDSEKDEVLAASARVPVGYAILGAYQLRWFVTQVDYPHLGKLCSLVIPCALTALDHWSPEVKGQGMMSFIHLAKNVNAADFGFFEDVILDACCQNIASDDAIWLHVVEMSVLILTSVKKHNPRSPWFEKILNEMLNHLERQPRNKERRIVWLRYIEPVFDILGLLLLVHFRRIWPLFLQWMHADDDETVLLVLKQVNAVIRLTWIRNSPYIPRLVDELVALFKESALRKAREEIRAGLRSIMILLQQCKRLQFEAAWEKHRDDQNLSCLEESLSSGRNTVEVNSSFGICDCEEARTH